MLVPAHAACSSLRTDGPPAPPYTPLRIVPLVCYTQLPVPPLRAYPLQLGLNLRLDKHPACPVDHVLSDGEQVGPLVVVHTPGHTSGHLAFCWLERRLMITGDIVATWPDLSPGWRGFTLDCAEHLQSVRRMADLRPEILAVGHGDPMPHAGHEHLQALVETAERWVDPAKPSQP